jgi:hypothetical protein
MFNITEDTVNDMGGKDTELSTEDCRQKFMNSVNRHNRVLAEPPILMNGSVAYSQQTPWI